MKRIINGNTYNTETATRLWVAENAGIEDALYITRNGKYFIEHASNPVGSHVVREILPVSHEEAKEWVEHYDLKNIIEAHFGESAKTKGSESRLTLRIPDALKHRVEEAAVRDGQSINAWIMQCLERAVPADE